MGTLYYLSTILTHLICSFWYGCEEGMVGVDRNVVVPHFHHWKYQNGCLKYIHEVYYLLAAMGCEVVKRNLEIAQPTKEEDSFILI